MDTAINGYYKLSWRERIGFCSGDLAQNLIYQTVSIWLLFYYNNVYGLDSAENHCMPMIIEHLDTDEEYVASVRYVRNVCSGR